MEAIDLNATNAAKCIRNGLALRDYKMKRALTIIEAQNKNHKYLIELDNSMIYYCNNKERLDVLKEKYRWTIKRVCLL